MNHNLQGSHLARSMRKETITAQSASMIEAVQVKPPTGVICARVPSHSHHLVLSGGLFLRVERPVRPAEMLGAFFAVISGFNRILILRQAEITVFNVGCIEELFREVEKPN